MSLNSHPKLPQLASGGNDNKVKIWDLKTNTNIVIYFSVNY